MRGDGGPRCSALKGAARPKREAPDSVGGLVGFASSARTGEPTPAPEHRKRSQGKHPLTPFHAPDRIRTCDLRLRRPTLYPTELRARIRREDARNKPSSVPAEAGEDHFSGAHIAADLVQPTRDSSGAGRSSSLLGLAPGGVFRATSVTGGPVRSYRTLSPLPVLPRGSHRRFAFCGTIRRLSPPGRYPAPCPSELGLSSGVPRTVRRRSSLARLPNLRVFNPTGLR
jgi:hypothetical protein